jgi:multimeric flavodoxin WrbA
MTVAAVAPRPRVVIVGAGFGGLSAARELSRHDVDIVLIDKQNHHLFQPLLYQVATAGLSPADIAQPIRSIVKKQKRTQVLLDNVDSIDRAARCVRLSSGADVPYDALILATGARHSYFGATWADRAPGIKTIDDAVSVRRTILLALEKAETSRQEHLEERAEFLTFVVVGGGPTGVEMAGAIAELTRAAAEDEFPHITRHCVRIILVQSDLDDADAIIMGAPTYMGSLSAPFKAFMDDSSHLQYAEKHWTNKVAAGFTNGASRGGDKQNSLVQLMTFAAQHQMHWVNLGLNYGNNRSVTNEEILNRDAYTLGVAAQANLDQGGDVAPPASDLRTAEHLGRRVAEVAQELVVGRAALGRAARPGIAGGSENQDPERRGIFEASDVIAA